MLTGAPLNMLADVYQRTRTRMPSGQWKEGYNYDEPTTIKCFVRFLPIEGFSASSREKYDDLAFDKAFLHLRTLERIPGGKTVHVGNIRTVDRYGREESSFVDDEGQRSVYTVTGEISKQEPWSNTIEWIYVMELPES